MPVISWIITLGRPESVYFHHNRNNEKKVKYKWLRAFDEINFPAPLHVVKLSFFSKRYQLFCLKKFLFKNVRQFRKILRTFTVFSLNMDFLTQFSYSLLPTLGNKQFEEKTVDLESNFFMGFALDGILLQWLLSRWPQEYNKFLGRSTPSPIASPVQLALLQAPYDDYYSCYYRAFLTRRQRVLCQSWTTE